MGPPFSRAQKTLSSIAGVGTPHPGRYESGRLIVLGPITQSGRNLERGLGLQVAREPFSFTRRTDIGTQAGHILITAPPNPREPEPSSYLVSPG